MTLLSGNDFWTAFAAVIAAIATAYGAFTAGRVLGRKEMKRSLSNKRELARFSEIYAPIVGMFAQCHITTFQARGAPYFRQRARNALKELREKRFAEAIKALFDKQDTGVSGEVEYGKSFPHDAIIRHLQERERHSDSELLFLVNRADRARYEDRPGENELTDADLNLLNHVFREYARLAKRFVGS